MESKEETMSSIDTFLTRLILFTGWTVLIVWEMLGTWQGTLLVVWVCMWIIVSVGIWLIGRKDEPR